MRTVKNLLAHKGKVFVYLKSENICNLFLKNAEGEGFTFGDRVKPTQREGSAIIALHQDWTINYVGWAGHIAFHHPDAVIGDPLIRVDYGKYLSGCDDYII